MKKLLWLNGDYKENINLNRFGLVRCKAIYEWFFIDLIFLISFDRFKVINSLLWPPWQADAPGCLSFIKNQLMRSSKTGPLRAAAASPKAPNKTKAARSS